MPTERDVLEAVTAYIEGTMESVDREAFERHLEDCDSCRRYLEQVRKATELTGRPPEQCLSREFQQHLTEAFGGIENA